VTGFTAFAELRTPKDLIRKLEHDFDRVEKWPSDQCAVFDFFITAEPIVDWIFQIRKTTRKHFDRAVRYSKSHPISLMVVSTWKQERSTISR
jgi:hypothetical protein